jgi:hypothetical protein
MTTMTSFYDAPAAALFDLRWERLRRVPRPVWALLALAALVIGGERIHLATQSPGEAIRESLVAAADEMLVPATAQPNRSALVAVGSHFGPGATVAAELWPHVTVTLHDVDRATCVDAAAAARRIERLVVVQLEKYSNPAECGASNDMTWWIMP